MKYLMTFESYQKYSDYKSGRWGSPADLEEDAIISVKHLLPTFDDKWIDKIEDQSVEDKGIKFEITVGRDKIQMIKTNSFRGQWEYYLNGKKKDSNEIKDYLESKYLSDIDKFVKYAKGYDYTAAYIDDGASYKKAQEGNQFILNLFDNLKPNDKKKALKTLLKTNKSNSKNINNIFGNRI